MIGPLEMAWLHAELDHDLDSTGRARLQAALGHSPELRAARAELLELDAALREGSPVPEPPPSLHARLTEMAAAASRPGLSKPDPTQPPTFGGVRRIGSRTARIGWREWSIEIVPLTGLAGERLQVRQLLRRLDPFCRHVHREPGRQ